MKFWMGTKDLCEGNGYFDFGGGVETLIKVLAHEYKADCGYEEKALRMV